MAKDIALPAFISSLHAVRELVDGILNNILSLESNDLSAVEREWSSGGLILAEGRDVGKQKSWSEPQAEAKVTSLLKEAEQVTRARLLAATRREREWALVAHLTHCDARDASGFRVTTYCTCPHSRN